MTEANPVIFDSHSSSHWDIWGIWSQRGELDWLKMFWSDQFILFKAPSCSLFQKISDIWYFSLSQHSSKSQSLWPAKNSITLRSSLAKGKRINYCFAFQTGWVSEIWSGQNRHNLRFGNRTRSLFWLQMSHMLHCVNRILSVTFPSPYTAQGHFVDTR